MEAYDAELTAAEARDDLEGIIAFVEGGAERLEAHEMERGIFARILALGRTLMKLYFSRRGTGDVGAAIIETGGRVLKRSKGLFERVYFSIFGKLEVPRTRYRARAGASLFPLDRQVNLPERCYSYVLQQMAERLDADMPFGEGSKYLEEFFGLELSESVLIDLAKDAAEEYDAYYETRRPPAAESEGEIQVVSFDGKGVPMIRKEAVKLKARLGKGEKRQRKKEALVGVGYTVDPNPRYAAELAESLVDPEAARARREAQGVREDPPRAQNIRRLARLGIPKKEVVSRIHADAERRDPEHQRPLAVLVDGAACLEALAREQFTSWAAIYFILDVIHVVEYLWGVANSLFGEKTEAGRSWVQKKLTQILEGRVGYVIGGLRQTLAKGTQKKSKRKLKKTQQDSLNKAITYFENHRDLMQYDEYLAAGLPVATSIVESSCGTLVKNRMEGSGKRWGIEGADAVLKLRSLKMSNDNDLPDFTRFRARRERRRLYGARPSYRTMEALDAAA
jgi:hypothetical protein